MFLTKKDFGESRIGIFNSIEFTLPGKGCEHFESHPFIFWYLQSYMKRLNPLPVKGNLVFYTYAEVCCRKIFAAKCLESVC